MFAVIFDKETKKIIKVIEITDKIITIGCSDNCAIATVEEKPDGQFYDGEPDPPKPEIEESEIQDEGEIVKEEESEEQSEENTETEKD